MEGNEILVSDPRQEPAPVGGYQTPGAAPPPNASSSPPLRRGPAFFSQNEQQELQRNNKLVKIEAMTLKVKEFVQWQKGHSLESEMRWQR